MDKIRLDKALLNQISSRAKAQDMIKEGKILREIAGFFCFGCEIVSVLRRCTGTKDHGNVRTIR